MNVRIKICGITKVNDAIAARDLGVGYLGFILYPRSPRYIEPGEILEIVNRLKEEERCPRLIGVFVNEPAEAVAEILDSCRLDYAQLSGDESPEVINSPNSPLLGRSFKGIQPHEREEAQTNAERYLPATRSEFQPALLVDAYHRSLRGGTGLTGDWGLAAELCRRIDGIMLAGGLNPDNVSEAVQSVRPFAVDVSTGVEDVPGRKNEEKMRAFVQAVKSTKL